MQKFREEIPVKSINRSRLILAFGLICVCLVLLTLRLGWWQIVKSDEYAARALRQQTSDSTVAATRGSILDRNGRDLAISATTNTVWVRTDSVKSNGDDDASIEANAWLEAKKLSEILGLDEEEVYKTITGDSKLIKLAKYVDKELAEQLREEGLKGIEITEDAKRYYPLGSFASQVIGATNDDNEGMTGLELYYNNYLAGLNGRWIKNKDSNSNGLSYGTNKYYAAEDGYTLVTTIDEQIQYIVEQKIVDAKAKCRAARVMCMLMDPSNGEILAMAQTDEYDPNSPRQPLDEAVVSAWDSYTSEQQVAYYNKIWRNFCINDTYEPGSTFKLFTTSLCLDAGVTYLGETFRCSGSIQVADRTLHCWYYPNSHGYETLPQAVENSCNPVMVTISSRLGLTKYYEGLNAFGFTERTGVDYPGEGYNILQKKAIAGPVGLATMSYGQGIAVTPVSLVSAVGAIANGGKLMQPHFMKQLLDSDGNVIEESEPVVKSIPISAQTASDVLSIMEMVVSEGGGGNAKIAGYRIGGKTGTANKAIAGGYSDTDVYASFIGVAPIEDPKFVILVIVDSPRGVLYGSSTAAPCAKEIMEDVLLYLNVEPSYSASELKAISAAKVKVPDLKGKGMEEAIGILGGVGLKAVIAPQIESTAALTVVDQFPKAGEELEKGASVTLYYK